MSRETRLRGLLESAFAPQSLILENESHGHSVPSGSETHFKLVMVSERFTGRARIDRQREVMDALREEFSSGLHALTMRLFTPDEWEKVRDGFQMVSPPCHGGSQHDDH